MAERRTPVLMSLSDIMPEVDRLLAGYEKAGNWSLGQACNHLAQTFRLSIEGFPVKVPWLLRALFGKMAKNEVFGKKMMRAGIKVPEKFLPKVGLDDRAEAEALRAAIAYYRADTSPRAPHPMFGSLTNAKWDELHAIHAAHHLSFLSPTASVAK